MAGDVHASHFQCRDGVGEGYNKLFQSNIGKKSSMEGDEGEVGVRGGLKGKVRHGKVEYRSVVCMECAAGHIQRLSAEP